MIRRSDAIKTSDRRTYQAVATLGRGFIKEINNRIHSSNKENEKIEIPNTVVENIDSPTLAAFSASKLTAIIPV